jgi:hypothetical protein
MLQKLFAFVDSIKSWLVPVFFAALSIGMGLLALVQVYFPQGHWLEKVAATPVLIVFAVGMALIAVSMRPK